MKTKLLFRTAALALISALAIGACSSVPVNNPMLERARADVSQARQNPRSAELAATELKRANDSLERANQAWRSGADPQEVDHLAYLSSQRAAISEETTRQKLAELSLANANATRDKIRLDARTREADSSKQIAESAQRQSADAARQSEASKRESEASQRQSEASQRQSNASAQVARDAQSRTAQLESQLKALNAKQTQRGMVITIGDMLFDTNRAQLKSGGLRSVDQLAEFFRANPGRNALVEGFTDSTGSESTNLELSDRRADAVRSALVDRGVDGKRISVQGYSEAYPVASNDNAGSRQMNRRVEIVLSDDAGVVAPR